MPRSMRKTVPNFLKVLRDATARLPDTVPCASISDPIYQNFHDKAGADEVGAFQSFEQAFKQCFKPDTNGPPSINNIMQGEHGMDLIILYLDKLAEDPTMSTDELRSTTLRISELVELVQEWIKEAPRPIRSNSGRLTTLNGKQKLDTSKIPVAKKVRFSNQSDGYNGDGEFTPVPEPESSEEELDMEAENEFGILGFGKRGNKEKQSDIGMEDTNQEVTDLTDQMDMDDMDDKEPPKPGREPAKGTWVMTHYNQVPKPRVRSNGTTVWAFNCKWCRAPCNVPRTPGVKNWEEEVKTLKNFRKSNFITHIEKVCRQVPKDQKYFDDVKARKSAKLAGTSSLVVSGVSINQREFNGSLARAVIHDNHSMTFGEGLGMIHLFQRILPDIRLPVHQTLQRHLYRLFDMLVPKVRDNLKGIERHAISTDAWSSKNSVYSIAGIIAFSIDINWHLNELVIDVVDLDADHSGSIMGKLVYNALRAKGAARQAIACVTDNASTNSVMNETLAARIRKHEDVHIHGKNMSFTCIAHAIHLICTELTSHLGVIEPGDHYSEVKGSTFEEDIDDNIEEMNPEPNLNFDTESDSNIDDDLLAELAPELANTDDEKPTGRASKRGQPKALTVIEKIHEIVVYATASPKRQKEMRQIISKTCSKDVKHLFLKKSIRIRWDSVRTELKRALQLRQAITFFVANLDSTQSRRGKSRKLIQKMQVRWNITGEEWDLGVMVGEVLDPFHTATEAMSRRDAATLADVIPTFALLERKLLENILQLQNIATDRGNATARALLSGLEAALVKLRKYQTLAHENQLCIIATVLLRAVLNPRFRLKYLARWPNLHSNASILVSHIFENYRVKHAEATDTPVDPAPHQNLPTSSKTANTWENELYSDVPSFVEHFDRELQAYFSGNYPCPSGMSTLDWWRVHHLHFPTVGHMARDFLCIPASSVSVERLFSQCKLTLTDVRASMSFETARRRICCQHWMKAGVDEDAIRRALEIDESSD